MATSITTSTLTRCSRIWHLVHLPRTCLSIRLPCPHKCKVTPFSTIQFQWIMQNWSHSRKMPHFRSNYRCRKITHTSDWDSAMRTTRWKWARLFLSLAVKSVARSISHQSHTGVQGWSAMFTLVKFCLMNPMKSRKLRLSIRPLGTKIYSNNRKWAPSHWTLEVKKSMERTMRQRKSDRRSLQKNASQTCSISNLSKSMSLMRRYWQAYEREPMRLNLSSDQKPKPKTLTLWFRDAHRLANP